MLISKSIKGVYYIICLYTLSRNIWFCIDILLITFAWKNIGLFCFFLLRNPVFGCGFNNVNNKQHKDIIYGGFQHFTEIVCILFLSFTLFLLLVIITRV